MNRVDGECLKCSRPIRWLTGTPRICTDCAEAHPPVLNVQGVSEDEFGIVFIARCAKCRKSLRWISGYRVCNRCLEGPPTEEEANEAMRRLLEE